ncbi:MAG: hypothetical protein NTV51_10835 [Verrucomicrobia bacterium]|nr:hypothetical protein [Verrucomicrobiota bacterium]
MSARRDRPAPLLSLRRQFVARAIAAFVTGFASIIAAAEPPALKVDDAVRLAAEVQSVLSAAVAAPAAERPSLGASLSAYAKNSGADPARHETMEEASRRILAGGTTSKRPPEETSRWLGTAADQLLAAVRAAETATPVLRSPELENTLAGLTVSAHLARFHARRILAAVHYNLFLRGQRLAELYAATMDAKTAVEIWRELATAAGDRDPLTFGSPAITLRGPWRAELKRLEFDYHDLEAQCCPPDEGLLREKVWTPPPAAPR